MSIQTIIVKSLAQMVTQLEEQATYSIFKSWLLAVKAWVLSYTHTKPNNLGPAIVCAMAHLTMSWDIILLWEYTKCWGHHRLLGLGGKNTVTPPGGR